MAIMHLNPFPHTYTFWHFRKQMTCKNISENGEMSNYEQFLLLPQSFQLYLIILLLFLDIFHIFCVFKVVCCRFVVCEKGLKYLKLVILRAHNIRFIYILVGKALFSTTDISPLTLSLMQPHFNTSSADDLWKYHGKKINW